jgi:hypothetical protein
MGLPKGMPALGVSAGYERVKDRKKKDKPSPPPEDEPGDAVEPPAKAADTEPRFGGFEDDGDPYS